MDKTYYYVTWTGVTTFRHQVIGSTDITLFNGAKIDNFTVINKVKEYIRGMQDNVSLGMKNIVLLNWTEMTGEEK